MKTKVTSADRIFYICCTSFLVLACIVVLYPLVYCISCSFSSTSAITGGKVWLWPVEVNLRAYYSVLGFARIRTGFLNSLLYVAGGTVVAVCLILLAAYPLSRKDFPGRKLFTVFFVITMFFNGGIIPNYMLMRNLNLIGSRWALIIGFVFSCYNMIIVKTYFQNSLPSGLLDAAQIDGCNDLRFFITIALPLAVPVIAVMVLFYAVWIWNSYFNGMLYLTNPATYSFQMVLRDILFVARMPQDMINTMDPSAFMSLSNILEQLRYAVLVVGALPMMALYPFIQKYFIRGMMIGSLKE